MTCIIVNIASEWKADLDATSSIKDTMILKEAGRSLQRMTSQAKKRWPGPIGWIQYILNVLFVDPHPPFIARRWLLRRQIRYLVANNQVSTNE